MNKIFFKVLHHLSSALEDKEWRSVIAIAGVILLIGVSTSAYAQIPRTINYQGYLMDHTGKPVDTTKEGPLQIAPNHFQKPFNLLL